MIFGMVLSAISLGIFVASFDIKAMLPMTPGPGFMPRVISVLLFLVSIGIAVEGFLLSRKLRVKVDNPASEGESRNLQGTMNVFKSMALLGIYVYSMEIVGFLVTTTLYIFFQSLILVEGSKKDKIWKIAATAISVSVITYFIFTKILYLMLPSGFIGI